MGTLEQRIEELEARVAALEKLVAWECARDEEELELLKEELSRPAERTSEDIARALRVAGIGEGPGDLSRNFRKYLRGERQ